MSSLTTPTTPLIRRRDLYHWLNAHGIKGCTVKKLLQTGVIPRKHLPGCKYGHYSVADVAAKLDIQNPLSTPTTTK